MGGRFMTFLERITCIGALPAQVMTYAIVLIWLAGAGGMESASTWWHENAGATTAFVQISIGIWLAYRVGGKVTDVMKENAQAKKETP